MCIVTFVPSQDGIYLTSNRDEQLNRKPALPPKQYCRKGVNMIFPRDEAAYGTWIVFKNSGDAAVLLNGAFGKHQRHPPYLKSRGVLLLEIMETLNPREQVEQVNLSQIEPFTLILYSKGELWEYRWDGQRKHSLPLNTSQCYIWSSVTLYAKDVAALRESRFKQYFNRPHLGIERETVLHFHRKNTLSRGHQIQTVSITSLFIGTKKGNMIYRDLQTNNTTTAKMDIKQQGVRKYPSISKQWNLNLRKLWISCTHWEYWPSTLVFAPMFFHWIWLSLKAKSPFFFSAANPGIAYAGFLQERKNEIYQLIPDQYYPRTLFFNHDQDFSFIHYRLTTTQWKFPLIAKPNQGRRGMQVKLIQNMEELRQYVDSTRVDFLLQVYVDYELEAGIFYYRLPGEQQGHISGIVEKEFLAVVGDGSSRIIDLLEKNDRALFQLRTLHRIYGNHLLEILPKGIRRILVPYGNHSKGAHFIDSSHRINPALNMAIDQLCRQIPGFYYGRLDIKFKSWEALAKGRDFAIIELNGAGSEPTHMYDPRHSLFFAWKEIYRHWCLLYKISKLNISQTGIQMMSIQDGLKMIRAHLHFIKLTTEK